MGLLDFKEIPEANNSDGTQDTFELFARDVLSFLGFTIIEEPDRGPDGGRDMIVSEKRTGLVGDSEIRWLVSCKHKAHSGKSVLDNDELDIPGRLEQFGCSGFMCFYSTLCSSGLSNQLNSYKNSRKYEICIFDYKKIESVLTGRQDGNIIIKRYFPISYKKHFKSAEFSNVFGSQNLPIKCAVCGKNLLNRNILKSYDGNVILAFDYDKLAETNKYYYEKVYCVCKGNCDETMKQNVSPLMTHWEDLSDLAIPNHYLRWIMGIINELRNGKADYSDEAFRDIKIITLLMAQVVMRSQGDEELQRIESLSELPEWI